jgi:RNA polymerase sigma factor (sigma-70 family)
MKTIADATKRTFMTAVMMGATLTSLALADTAQACNGQTIQNISRYCNSCWRNARVSPDLWTDCTQEVFVRLMERVDVSRWETLLTNVENPERKEFLRAIDAVKKRTKRARVQSSLAMDPNDPRGGSDSARNEIKQLLEGPAAKTLSSRQKDILALSKDGYSVEDIATRLNASPARVSDEKYKAIRKIQKELKSA